MRNKRTELALGVVGALMASFLLPAPRVINMVGIANGYNPPGVMGLTGERGNIEKVYPRGGGLKVVALQYDWTGERVENVRHQGHPGTRCSGPGENTTHLATLGRNRVNIPHWICERDPVTGEVGEACISGRCPPPERVTFGDF